MAKHIKKETGPVLGDPDIRLQAWSAVDPRRVSHILGLSKQHLIMPARALVLGGLPRTELADLHLTMPARALVLRGWLHAGMATNRVGFLNTLLTAGPLRVNVERAGS